MTQRIGMRAPRRFSDLEQDQGPKPIGWGGAEDALVMDSFIASPESLTVFLPGGFLEDWTRADIAEITAPWTRVDQNQGLTLGISGDRLVPTPGVGADQYAFYSRDAGINPQRASFTVNTVGHGRWFMLLCMTRPTLDGIDIVLNELGGATIYEFAGGAVVQTIDPVAGVTWANGDVAEYQYDPNNSLVRLWKNDVIVAEVDLLDAHASTKVEIGCEIPDANWSMGPVNVFA